MGFHINHTKCGLLTLDLSREVSAGVIDPEKVYMSIWKDLFRNDCKLFFVFAMIQHVPMYLVEELTIQNKF